MSCVVAFGAISALGEGRAAFAVPEPGVAPPVAVTRDAELEAAGLGRPYAARAGTPLAEAGGDRAIHLLERASELCAEMLDEREPGWRGLRIGLVVGTSSGGLRTCERLFAGQTTAELGGTFSYFAGLPRLVAHLGLPPCRASLVLGACASSTLALGLASAWLDQRACDLVIAGGYDALGVFVAAGFEAIRATSRDGVMRPFSLERDGLVLGEGAGLIALVRDPRARAFGYVRGFGASTDAVHLTAPDRSGGGLARAGRAALEGSGLAQDAIGIVSAHGTATDYNDAAEAKAIDAILGASAARAVLHALKPQIGHTLGAAGVLESLACLDALARGILPASAGVGATMPELAPRLLARGEPGRARAGPGRARAGLKLSAAFGGANASVVLALDPAGTDAPIASATGRVRLSRAVHVACEPGLEQLALGTGMSRDKLARTDRLTRLALAAVAELRSTYGSLEGAGIVVGHGLATHETNALFWDVVSRRGARFAEPRRFPFTSPNAPCGECAIAFRLTGPGFAVGLGEAGGLEALATASTLLRAGHAGRVVVVAVDDVGPASLPYLSGPSGAVALLATLDAGEVRGGVELIDAEVRVGIDGPVRPLAPAHQALLPLAAEAPPDLLECGPAWGVFARVRLRAVE